MTDVSDIIGTGTPARLCVSCGESICPERLAQVPDSLKCADCQADGEQDAFYVMEAALSGSEGKTSNIPVRMDKKTYRSTTRRPGYGSNLRFDRK